MESTVGPRNERQFARHECRLLDYSRDIGLKPLPGPSHGGAIAAHGLVRRPDYHSVLTTSSVEQRGEDMRRDMSLDGGFFERWVHDVVRGDKCCEVVRLVASRLCSVEEAARMEYDGGLWPLRRARWGEDVGERWGTWWIYITTRNGFCQNLQILTLIVT